MIRAIYRRNKKLANCIICHVTGQPTILPVKLPILSELIPRFFFPLLNVNLLDKRKKIFIYIYRTQIETVWKDLPWAFACRSFDSLRLLNQRPICSFVPSPGSNAGGRSWPIDSILISLTSTSKICKYGPVCQGVFLRPKPSSGSLYNMDSNFPHEDQRRVSKNLVVFAAKSLFFFGLSPK